MDVIWWVTATVGAVAINLIASELFAWGPRLSECLMRRAVRRLASEMQERMREEWAAHLQTIPPGLWRIMAAAGFYLATRQINVALRVREREEKPEEKTLQVSIPSIVIVDFSTAPPTLKEPSIIEKLALRPVLCRTGHAEPVR